MEEAKGLSSEIQKGTRDPSSLLDNLDDEHNVVFGMCPPNINDRRTPLAGDEEQALLGSLERRFRQDRCHDWNDRIDKGRSSSIGNISTYVPISIWIAVRETDRRLHVESVPSRNQIELQDLRVNDQEVALAIGRLRQVGL